MNTVAVLNGPNLNRLGQREPGHYGTATLEQILRDLEMTAANLGARITHFQSNHEGELIDKIHQFAAEGITLGIINPAALTHTSIALRDAIASTSIRFVEVHLSNVHQREEFRQRSLTAPVCAGQICGLGAAGYSLALRWLLQSIET